MVQECQEAQHVVMSKCHVAFQLEELDIETDTERTEREKETERSVPCPSSLWPNARPARQRNREDGRVLPSVRGCRLCVCVCLRGQTFPWQDPRDPAEGRVQPLKERLRARQSISGLHLHNKWSSHGFTHARTHTTYECIHSALISTRRRKVREMRREGEGERAIE